AVGCWNWKWVVFVRCPACRGVREVGGFGRTEGKGPDRTVRRSGRSRQAVVAIQPVVASVGRAFLLVPQLFVESKQFRLPGRAMDRFDAMQAFVRAVESGSFTRAAQDLDLGRA